jgi:hypothetical protein
MYVISVVGTTVSTYGSLPDGVGGVADRSRLRVDGVADRRPVAEEAQEARATGGTSRHGNVRGAGKVGVRERQGCRRSRGRKTCGSAGAVADAMPRSWAASGPEPGAADRQRRKGLRDVKDPENPRPALRAKPAAGGTGGRPPGRYQGSGKLGRRPNEHESLMRRRDRSAAADGGTAWRAFPFADGGTAWSQRRRTTSPYKVADTQTSRELRDTPATSTPRGRRDQRHAAHGRPTVLSLAHG